MGEASMDTTASNINNSPLELPISAPQLRITAGLGSAGQKTWNLRRPVTLVGSRRPAHIVVHDNNVSKAHCVIVNTGTDVLLKDLHTKGGTFQNNKPVDLVVLKDGDVILVGSTKFHIAIRTPESLNDDSGCGLEYVSPLEFAEPLSIHFVHSDKQWKISDAVTLIGRHEESQIRLDHSEISERHAVLFRFKNEPAMADLGSRTGVTINSCPCICGLLANGDRLGIGPYILSNGSCLEMETSKGHLESNNDAGNDSHDTPFINSIIKPLNSANAEPLQQTASGVNTASDTALASNVEHRVSQTEGLQEGIANSWERINQWQARLREDEERLSRQDTDLASRETELEARGATLRGQLHDLSRYNEQIMARERELGAQLAELQELRDQVKGSQSDLVKREGEMAKRNDELRRREHVLAQRWARLLSATCAHCQQPVRPSHSEDQALTM